MNKVILSGRLTRDPEVRYANEKPIARYSLAVDRRFSNETDFFNCVTFGKSAEFAEKYLKKGTKIMVTGRLQTGSYDNKEGHKVNTVDVVVEDHEFCESKGEAPKGDDKAASKDSGFMQTFEGVPEKLPFD